MTWPKEAMGGSSYKTWGKRDLGGEVCSTVIMTFGQVTPQGGHSTSLSFPLPVSCWFSPYYKSNRTGSQRARRSTLLWVRIQKQRAGRSRALEEQMQSILKHRRYGQGGNDWHLKCRGRSGRFLEVLASLVLYTAAKDLGDPPHPHPVSGTILRASSVLTFSSLHHPQW